MAAKLTFEASMQGMEKVLDLLKQAEQKMNDAGRIGTYSFDNVDKKIKDLTSSLDVINKSQAGMGGLFKSFDEVSKKSNEFLSKGHKGLIDAMKADVKAFEGETDKILNKIKEAERELNNFKSRKAAMSEQDYQQGVSNRQRDINQQTAEMVSIHQTKRSMEREIYNREIVGGAFGQRMTEWTGTPFTADVRNQMAIKGIAGAAGMIPAMLEFGSQASGAVLHQRYGQRMNEFIAQQSLMTNAGSAAMGFNPNATFLQRYGGGYENQMVNDPAFESKVRLAQMGQSWWSTSLKYGAAGAVGGGFFGAVPGAVIGGVGGLVAGAAMGLASEKTEEQIRAELTAEAREKDKVYTNITSPAAQGLKKEIDQLKTGQRMFGADDVHTAVSMIAKQGVSQDRATPILQEMFRYGIGPGEAAVSGDVTNIDNAMRKYGISREAAAQIIRYSAGTGTQMRGGLDGVANLYGISGLGGTQAYGARSELDKYIAQMASERGPGVSMQDVGAGFANVVGAAGGSNKYGEIPAVMQVEQGQRSFESASGLMNKAGSLANTALISKLRQLGVTSAVAIDAFIDMGIGRGDEKAINAVAKYINPQNPDVKAVRSALGGIGALWEGAVEGVIGSEESARFKSATGMNISTLKTQGIKGGDYEALTGKGGTAAAMSAMYAGVPSTIPTVEPGKDTPEDALIKGQADIEVKVNEEIKKMIQGTGDTVVQGIVKSVLDGFALTAKAVEEAGKELQKTKSGNTTTFGGTKPGK